MSYEDAVEAMRNRSVEPAPFERLAEKPEFVPPPVAGRFSIAAIATAVGSFGFFLLFVRPLFEAGALYSEGVLRLQLAALLPAFVLGWSFPRVSTPRLGAQLLCRAVWWSSLVVGLLVSMNYGDVADKALGALIAVACATALRSAGERGLDLQEPDHPFAPVRFRGHLLLALVMAAADALTLAFSGLMQLRFGMEGWNLSSAFSYAGPTIFAAAVMAIAVWGVYRLRTWALFLNLFANIAIAYFAVEGSLGLSPTVSISLASTAAIQCFIPVPILAVALGDRNAGQPLLARVRHRAMNYTVLALATLSVGVVALPGSDGWVDGPGRAFVRGTSPRSWVQPGAFSLRLMAMDGELQGARLDGRMLFGEDFSGFDMQEASLRSVHLRDVTLANADLRGADFTRAVFEYTTSDIKFRLEGALVERADFTGSFVSETVWAVLAQRGLEGVRCPDGTMATPGGGCDGHLGHIPRGYRRVFTFATTSTDGSVACGREGDLTVMLSEGEALLHRNTRYVQLAEGDFVSPLSRIHPLEDGRWEISSELCGDNILLPIDETEETAAASLAQ
ncbi:MAG: pentapeptide repeat-containing protein [Nannocystales bacterium]